MNNNIDRLKNLLEKIKTIGFWERLFSWQKVKTQLFDALADLQKLTGNADSLAEQYTAITAQYAAQAKDLDMASNACTRSTMEIEQLNTARQQSSS